jgi:RIO-like serine/threonine protein kinase
VNEQESRTPPWETARRVLLAAVVEANGRAGAYVIQELVMQQAKMDDAEHFRTIARYLEEQGWIEDADADYGVFRVTASGIAEVVG